MNIATAKQQIKDTIEAYLQKDDAGMYMISPVHQRPVFLLGAPGIGKTAIMEQIARELEIGIVSYSMTHHTRQSALGLPRIEHREFEGYEYEASEYTMSEIIAALYDYMNTTGLRRGILFLDEINCVSETLYPSMLQFLQFKTFGKHKVPDDWVVVCAGNPAEYNRSVHEFDIVTLDRMREIDVEPEYGSWKAYAAEKGLHPAVTTFLETKKDCFYKVESRPGGGKAFVTARGWEDLAQIISLYESMEKPVSRDLFAQFLRDEEIVDQFAVYYALFEKYRSDYQVDAILSGEVGESIRARAAQAEFDERIALMSLLLDALSGDCAQVLDLESIALELRDTLRGAKSELLGGASVNDALGTRIHEREMQLSRRKSSGVAAQSFIRREQLVLAALKELVQVCMLANTCEGEPAFSTIETAYKEKVAALKPAAQKVSERMDCAFDFVDACFGSREMLVFMAELATRKPTTQFVAHYGNDKYYAHNQELQVDSTRMGLVERASLLEDLADNIKQEEQLAFDETQRGGIAVGGSISAAQPLASKVQASSVSSAAIKDDVISDEALRAHYSNKKFEYGFASVCEMHLPASELKGKKMLNVGCRRGRGVYKMSSMAGNAGSVIGVDWNEGYILEAQEGSTRAWHESGLKANNIDFRMAYPENLIAAGLGTSTVDVVYVNNVINLFYSQQKTLEEFGRVLRPGGLLVLETVVADRPRSEQIVSEAREMGNSIQAATTYENVKSWLNAAGFDAPVIEDEYEVVPQRGYRADSVVEIVPGDDEVNYKAVTLFVHKK